MLLLFEEVRTTFKPNKFLVAWKLHKQKVSTTFNKCCYEGKKRWKIELYLRRNQITMRFSRMVVTQTAITFDLEMERYSRPKTYWIQGSGLFKILFFSQWIFFYTSIQSKIDHCLMVFHKCGSFRLPSDSRSISWKVCCRNSPYQRSIWTCNP